jgi:hypothetical protein
MPSQIRSLLSWGPLWLPLKGGDLRLTPGELSPEIADADIQDNKVVEKLSKSGMIQVTRVTSPAPTAKSTKRQSASSGPAARKDEAAPEEHAAKAAETEKRT